MDIIDIRPLPQHEDLARKAQILLRATPKGEPVYPQARTSYVFFSLGEQVSSVDQDPVPVPFTERFIAVPTADVEAVLIQGQRTPKEDMLRNIPEGFDPSDKILTIGVVFW